MLVYFRRIVMLQVFHQHVDVKHLAFGYGWDWNWICSGEATCTHVWRSRRLPDQLRWVRASYLSIQLSEDNFISLSHVHGHFLFFHSLVTQIHWNLARCIRSFGYGTTAILSWFFHRLAFLMVTARRNLCFLFNCESVIYFQVFSLIKRSLIIC